MKLYHAKRRFLVHSAQFTDRVHAVLQQSSFFHTGKAAFCEDNVVEQLNPEEVSCLLYLAGDGDILAARFE